MIFRRKKRDPYPNPREVRDWFERGIAYWEARMAAGDPLFDEWMWDRYEALKDGVELMDRLDRLGMQTKRSPRHSK